jgi:hypothetical protein
MPARAWRRTGTGLVAFGLVCAASGCGSDDQKTSREDDGSGGTAESATGGGPGSATGGNTGGELGGTTGTSSAGDSATATGGTAGSGTGGDTTGTTGGSGGSATGGATGGTAGSGTGGDTTGTTGGSAGSGGDGTSGQGGAAGSGTGGVSGSTGGAAGNGALPEGNAGIAVRYPGDVGIDADSAVLFADDFESYAQSSELDRKWTYFYQTQLVAITTDPANVYAGNQALQFTIPQQTDELSDGVDKDISPEQDVLYLRFYSKFMPPYDVVGSSHNGGGISAHYFGPNNQATPGVPADGTNKFLVNLENWRGDEATTSPGQLNVYVYHPEQRSQWGDHFYPTGLVNPNTSIPFDFGPDFVSRPDIIQDLDRWYCYELMVQANTPGLRDGRIAAWLDGVLAMDFMNLRLRDVDTLTINRVGIGLHIGSNPNGEARTWYDNVVVATSYIGPMVPP